MTAVKEIVKSAEPNWIKVALDIQTTAHDVCVLALEVQSSAKAFAPYFDEIYEDCNNLKIAGKNLFRSIIGADKQGFEASIVDITHALEDMHKRAVEIEEIMKYLVNNSALVPDMEKLAVDISKLIHDVFPKQV